MLFPNPILACLTAGSQYPVTFSRHCGIRLSLANGGDTPAVVALTLFAIIRGEETAIVNIIDKPEALRTAAAADLERFRLRRFVERLGVPVFVTPKAKGLLAEDHSLF